jgi:phosphohistidine phosphatase
MKALILLRHAESGEKLPGQSDHKRELTAKGLKQSAAVAGFMKEKELHPDEVIASDAARVKSTLDHLIKHLGTRLHVTYAGELYDADVSGYLDVVRKAPDCQTLLIAGHNPGIGAFASYISKTKVRGIGPADLLVFHFKENDWSQLNKGKCELMEHFVP